MPEKLLVEGLARAVAMLPQLKDLLGALCTRMQIDPSGSSAVQSEWSREG